MRNSPPTSSATVIAVIGAWSLLTTTTHSSSSSSSSSSSFLFCQAISDNLFDEDEILPSLFPFRTEDYVGFSVAILGLVLAAGGGIGGGGILVPTYILLLDFPVKHAIPLASATVFGGAVANNLLNAREGHPEHPHRPIIDWDLILQLEPMTILGAMIGTTIYDFIPDVLLVVLMIILLSVTAYKTLSKATKMYERETQELLDALIRAKAEEEEEEEEADRCEITTGGYSGVRVESPTKYEGGVESPTKYESMDVEGARKPPPGGAAEDEEGADRDCVFGGYNGVGVESPSKYKSMDVEVARKPPGGAAEEEEEEAYRDEIFGGYSDVGVESPTKYESMDVDGARKMPGGAERYSRSISESGSENSFDELHRSQAVRDGIKLTALFAAVTALSMSRGSPEEGGMYAFWATDGIVVVLIAAFAVHTRWKILERYQLDGGPTLSDIAWDESNTIVYPLYAVIAGLAAGMFGVGGGIIKGPLMLALGVHPAVASASSACMILYTSSISTLSYMTFGSLVYDYGAFCLAVGFCATLLGQTLMKELTRRYRRASLIAFSIGGVVMLSAVAMGIDGTIALLDG